MKITINKTIMAVIAIFVTNAIFAQQEESPIQKPAPIPLEVFFGEEGWTSQLVIDKKFGQDSKLGFFGLTYIHANYDNDEYLRESINLSVLKYDVFNNVSVLAGSLFNSHWGFRPYAGAQYAYHSKTFMGMLNSGFHLTETRNFETIAMLEYRPVIKKEWSLYSRVQGMYSQNTLIGEHDRSHMYGRLGVSYKTFTFGAALNYDWYGYGAMKIEEGQLGLFVSTLLW